MSRFLFLLFCSLLCHFGHSQEDVISADIAAAKKSATGTTYALVIGISSYPNLKQLQFADDDAYLFSNFLVNQNICLRKNLTLLIDSQATNASVNEGFRSIYDKVKPNDNVFFYFGGHGDVEKWGGTGYLLGYTCVPSVYSSGDAITLNTVNEWMGGLVGEKKAKVTMIIDACRSGTVAGGMRGVSSSTLSDNDLLANVIKLASCQVNQVSLEKQFPDGGHGVFTYYLVNGLSGLADRQNRGTVSLGDISSYLAGEVTRETNGQQYPHSAGNMSTILAHYDLNFKKNLTEAIAKSKPFHSGKERSVRDTVIIQNEYHRRFLEHIKRKELAEPVGNNAYNDFVLASRAGIDSNLLFEMKSELVIVLQDKVQNWLNRFLQGKVQYERSTLQLADVMRARKYLRLVESIIGKNDFQYDEIHVKRLFFDAYFDYTYSYGLSDYRRSLQKLEKADAMKPHQPWIILQQALINFQLDNFKEAEKQIRWVTKVTPGWAYAWYVQGSLLSGIDTVNSKEAELAFRTSINLDSSIVSSWEGLAALERRKHDKNREKAILQKGADANPNIAQFYLSLAKYHEDKEEFKLAENFFRQAANAEPENPDMLLDLASFYKRRDKNSIADSILSIAVIKDTTDVGVASLVAYYYQLTGDIAKAKKISELGIMDRSNSIFSWNIRGLIYQENEDFVAAEQAFLTAIQIDSTEELTWSNLAYLYEDMEDAIKQEFAVRKSVEADPDDPFRLGQVASFYDDQGNVTEAETWYLRALAVDTLNWLSLDQLVSFYRSKKQFSKAVEFGRRSVRLHSEEASSWKNLAEIYRAQQLYENEAEVYEEMIRSDSANFYFWQAYGDYKHRIGKFDAALSAYRQMTKLEPTNLEGLEALAGFYEGLDLYDEAISVYKELINSDTASRYFPRMLALTQARAGYKYQTLETYEAILAKDSSNAEAWIWVAEALHDLKRDKEAERAFRKATKVEPLNYENWQKLGDFLLQNKRLAEAETAYTKIVSIDKTNPVSWIEMGEAWLKLNKENNAVQSFQKALHLDSINERAMQSLAGIYENQKKYSLAELLLKKRVKAYPRRGEFKLQLGEFYERIGNTMHAEVTYLSLFANDTMNTAYIDRLADFYEKLSDFDRARELRWKAIEINPEIPHKWYNLATFYGKAGIVDSAIYAIKEKIKLEAGLDDFDYYLLSNYYGKKGDLQSKKNALISAVSIKPTEAFNWTQLGDIYAELASNDSAIISYEKAMQLDSLDSWTPNYIGYVYRTAGNYPAALSMFKKAVSLDPKNTHHWNGLFETFNTWPPDSVANFDSFQARRVDLKNWQERKLKEFPKEISLLSDIAFSYTLLENYTTAEKYYLRHLKASPQDGNIHYDLASLYAEWKKPEYAFTQLELAVKYNSRALLYIDMNTSFDAIRETPRFNAIMKRYRANLEKMQKQR